MRTQCLTNKICDFNSHRGTSQRRNTGSRDMCSCLYRVTVETQNIRRKTRFNCLLIPTFGDSYSTPTYILYVYRIASPIHMRYVFMLVQSSRRYSKHSRGESYQSPRFPNQSFNSFMQIFIINHHISNNENRHHLDVIENLANCSSNE